MARAQGRVFTRLVQPILVLGLLFLILEVHQLRVAVEDVGLGYGGDDRAERLIAALEEPLETIGRRLGQISVALEQPAMLAGDPAVPAVPALPAVAGEDSPPAVTVSTPERTVVVTRMEAQLSSFLKRIDRRPQVAARSLPPPSSDARRIDRQAVLKSLASLQSSPLEKSRFLAMTPKELLARYGKPSWIGVGEGAVTWNYDLTGRWETGSFIVFKLYDGRVIGLSY